MASTTAQVQIPKTVSTPHDPHPHPPLSPLALTITLSPQPSAPTPALTQASATTNPNPTLSLTLTLTQASATTLVQPASLSPTHAGHFTHPEEKPSLAARYPRCPR